MAPDTATETLVYGQHAVSAILAHESERVTELWVQAGRRDRRMMALLSMAESSGIVVQPVARDVLDRMAMGARHQGVVVRYVGKENTSGNDLEAVLNTAPEPPIILALDCVQDPHNLGACLRVGDAAGVHAVLAPKHRAVGLTPTVRKVASGAVQCVPFFRVPNLSQTLTWLHEAGLMVMGSVPDATMSVYEADLRGPLVLVIGGEAKGLRRLTRKHCDRLVRIPMMGQVESLNASVAAAVLLYEVRRQRGFSRKTGPGPG
jgi:23S rRNA (guanosine2251-2'-O)-methyltransferase